MEVKGTSASSTYNFVKTNYPDKLHFWLESLPEASKQIFSNTILATHWYPIHDGLIIPTKHVGKVFYDNDEKKASRELGRNSAKVGLNGVYSFFIKISKPGFVLKKAPRIFSTYYSSSSFEIVEDGPNFATFKILGFGIEEKLIIYRIEGWIEMVLEIIGEKNHSVKSEIIESNGEIISYIEAKW